MEITKCPSCGIRLLPKSDGTCPSCQSPIDLAGPLPVATEKRDPVPVKSQAEVIASIVGKYSAKEKADRLPTGLAFLALMQFAFLVVVGLNLVAGYAVVISHIAAGLPDKTGPRYWLIVVMFTMAILLLCSAIGYLSRHRILGYWAGNFMSAEWIIAVMIYNELYGFASNSVIARLVLYPVFLLCVLNLHYRKQFH